MPVIYNWDTITEMYKTMYEQTKDSELGIQRMYANHALGMLRLIPQIRDFPEFKDFRLDMSLGKLMCISNVTDARAYLACEDDFVYMETYEKQSGYAGMNKLSLEEFIVLLPQVLQQLSTQ